MNADSQFAQYPSLGGKIVLITGGASGIGAPSRNTSPCKGRRWTSSILIRKPRRL